MAEVPEGGTWPFLNRLLARLIRVPSLCPRSVSFEGSG